MSLIPSEHISLTPIIDTEHGPHSGSAEEKRAEIRNYFLKTWEVYENLFEGLADDSVFYERPEPLRHPLIFYFGHTATFFSNKLVVSKIIDRRVRPNIESMMAIGVDEMSWDDLDESHYNWPSADEVRSYRDEVKALVLNLIDTLPLTLPIQWEDPFWIILMGIEHERIHLETSSVLIRQLPISSVKPHPNWPYCPHTDNERVLKNRLLPVTGKAITQGRSQPAPTYGWDNEYGHLQTEVADFKASAFLVSNREFLNFIQDDGYQTKDFWTEEGWNWVQYKKATHPHFWIPFSKQPNRTDETNGSSDFKYRTLFEEIDMPWNWPADVNQLEAKAFCNWLSAKNNTSIRLPSEPEWYRLSEHAVQYDCGGRVLSEANIDLKHWASSCPVDTFEHHEFYDVTGNVWQWTETAMDGFDGFSVHPAYDDFSVPTFDGRHNMIKGGSWITTGNESLHDSRFAFRRHFIQHAGFRYVESDTPVSQKFNAYESDPQIAQYLEFHFGNEYLGVPNFPKTCIDTLIATIGNKPLNRVLDMGCAVGRSSFELAKHAQHVDAVDFSTRFISNALNLVADGSVRYLITDEGDIQLLKKAQLDDLNLAEHTDRIEFTQGDAANLKPIYQGYDLIFAGNLIEHLYEPAAFLRSIHERLNSEGILVLTSTGDWDESHTKKEHWLGGIKVNGENKTTLDGLQEILKPHFEELAPPADIPFVQRETSRTFQHAIAQMTYWIKK